MTNEEKDFEAAVIDIRRGNAKNFLKFGAFLTLVFIGAYAVIALAQYASTYAN